MSKNIEGDSEKQHPKKWYQKSWAIVTIIIILLFIGLGVYGNIKKANNQKETARLQLDIQRKIDKNDCLIKAAEQSKSQYYNEATDGPAIAACNQKYGK